jgi:chromosome partitioning protein
VGVEVRRIVVINQKGGVGKTTTTANLGAALARLGRRVLLIDLDPQAHLTLHYGVTVADDQFSVYDVLVDGKPLLEALRLVRQGVTLLPSSIDLAGAETELVSVVGRETVLREALDACPESFDFVLIDCPPSLGILTLNALTAAREALIPMQAQFLALQGLSQLLETIRLVRQRMNPALHVGGIVLCMHDAGTRLGVEVLDDLDRFLRSSRGAKDPWSEAVIHTARIRRTIKLAEAAGFGQTVFEYAPKSHGAADYEQLAQEINGGLTPANTPSASLADSSPAPDARSAAEETQDVPSV